MPNWRSPNRRPTPDLAWVKSKATADSGFLTNDSTSWDGMVHTESQAVDTFAHADDAAAKTEGDSIGADEAGTLVPQAQADETQESGDAAATGDFSTDEDQQAATEWQTLANQLGTPWAEEQAGEQTEPAWQPSHGVAPPPLERRCSW